MSHTWITVRMMDLFLQLIFFILKIFLFEGYMKVPETPLCTPAVLAEEREQWGEMQVRIRFLNSSFFLYIFVNFQEEMSNALATMRVDYDQVQIKNLPETNNKLLAKRKKKEEKQM